MHAKLRTLLEAKIFSSKSLPLPKWHRPLSWRRMQEEDIDAVCALEKRLFSSPWTKTMFRQELAEPELRLAIVVEDKKIIVGYVIIHYIIDEIHITNIGVAPDYQRRGIAFACLTKLLAAAAATGFVEAHLEVRKSNHGAIALYRRLGFLVVGERKNYYQPENEDALLMSCNLANPSANKRRGER